MAKMNPVSAIGAGVLSLCLNLASPQGVYPAAAPLSSRTPFAYAGKALVVRVGEVVPFHGQGASPDEQVVEYSWDFESDGVLDFVSAGSGETTHVFASPGDYECLLKVRDSSGRTAQSTRRVQVVLSDEVLAPLPKMPGPTQPKKINPADGTTHRYAILFNGGAEERYWLDMTLCYAMLTNRYGFPPADIFLLQNEGTINGGNPDGMIDYPATPENLETVVSNLTTVADLDDEVFFCITDHGRGYSGPLSQGGAVFGYLDGRASVEPGDEPDFPESSFKLRSLMTGGDYLCNHGMNEWKVFSSYYSGRTLFYRHNYVSHFDALYIASLGTAVSDHDILIEHLKDYATGDFNKDGYIDTRLGEMFDYDGDGVPAYSSSTQQFDEDDWGLIDELEDDYSFINTQVPEGAWPYKIFDKDFEGKLCIDLGYAGGELKVDGRDEDGLGLFDWMDVNQDGDTNDMISIDEAVCSLSDPIYDDDLRVLLNQLSVARITIVAEPCFSGGLVEDLSSSNRVICTAATEDAVSWGDFFIRGFIAALHGRDEYGSPVNADSDQDGAISMLESFNFAESHDIADEIPQYDDNGDKTSHEGPVPSGGDGLLGASTYLSGSGTVTNFANEWVKSTSGYWEEPYWSLGQLPARGQGMVAVRNAGWKAVAIGQNTVANPGALAVDNLTIEGPIDSFNMLFLNYAGLDVPLVVDSDLLIGTNASLLSHYSAIRGGNFYLSSAATILDGSQVAFSNVVVGSSAPAQLSITNSSLSAESLTLNPLGAITQSGGSIEVCKLRMSAGSTFVISGAAALTAPLIEIGPDAVMVLAGGTISNGETVVLRGGGLRVDGQQGLGKLQVVEGTNDGSSGISATLYVGAWGGLADPHSVLRFQDSRDMAWSGPGLSIVGWTREKENSPGDHVFVGNLSQGLSESQLGHVSFIDPAGWPHGNYAAQILVTGELIPAAPILNLTRNHGQLILSWAGPWHLLASTNVSGVYLPVPGAVSPFTNSFDSPKRFFRLVTWPEEGF